MAPQLFTIKKRATFVHIRDNGIFIRSKNINIQKLVDQDLDSKIGVGYTSTKKIGNAVKRNKAKRIMRELAKKILIKCKTNTYYVLIAKTSILNIKFKDLLEELENIINSCISTYSITYAGFKLSFYAYLLRVCIRIVESIWVNKRNLFNN